MQIDDKLFQFALNCINCFNHMDRATPRAARLAAPGDQLMAKGPSPHRSKKRVPGYPKKKLRGGGTPLSGKIP